MLRFLVVATCVAFSCHSIPVSADEAILIASVDSNGPKQPQAAVSSNGVVHVVFGSGDEVSHCSSSDNGKSFSKPSVAFRVSNLSLGMRRGPRITAFGDSLIVTAIGGKQGKGRDGDLLAWRSDDLGRSWKGPVQVNDSNDSASEGLHAMAVSSKGESWCTWLDLRNQRTELYASKTSDGGASWSANQLIYSSPEKSICECCHPSIAVHGSTLSGATLSGETVQVLFRNSLAGNRDMYLTSVEQVKGKNKTSSMQLGRENWKLNACPMDGGMLAIDANGVVSTVWRRGREIYTAVNDGGDEQHIGIGEQPWITSTKDGPIAVWTKRRDGELMMKNISNEYEQSIAPTARDAVIVAEPLKGKTAFVIWEQNEGGRSSIFAKAVETQ